MSIVMRSLSFTTALAGAVALHVLAPTSANAQATGSDVSPANGERADVIVVTSTRTELNLSDAPASMSVVSADDIALTAAVDVLDAIRQTPGISFQGRGVGGRQVMSVRGMGSDQTLFLVDGRRTVSSDNVFGHSDFQYNWLPTTAIARIEVVRGPLSALYGSEALGGVVNIITKPTPDTWTGSIAARYSIAEDAGDQQYAGLYASGPVGDKVGALFSYTFNDQEEVPLAEDPSLSELEGKQFHSGYGRITWEPAEGHRFDADLGFTTEDRFHNTNSRGRPPVYETSYDLDKLQYGASYAGTFGEIDARVNYYHSELEQVNHNSRGISPSEPQTLSDDVLDAHVVWPVSAAHRLVFGGEYREETLEHADIANGEATTVHQAVFAQDEWRVSDALLITVGARFDDHELFGSETSPRAYVVYHVNDQLTFKGGYGHGFRAPTIKQSSPEYLFVGPHSFVGNANVGPETSDNFEAGVVYDAGNLHVGVTAFVNQVEDLITTQCIGNCLAPFGRLFTYVNVSETETRGVESEIEYGLGDAIVLRASHVYMDAEDTTTGLQLAERPEHAFNASVAWTFDEPGVTAMISASYLGDQVQYDSTGGSIEMPGYTLWNLNGSWDASDTIDITFGVKNISDLRLAEESANYGYAERGRTFYLGVRRNF